MAAPQVAAVAAMMRALNPYASLTDLLRIIKQTASRPPGVGFTSDLGWGILNAGAALDATRRLDRLPPTSHRQRAPDLRPARAPAPLDRRRSAGAGPDRLRDRPLRPVRERRRLPAGPAAGPHRPDRVSVPRQPGPPVRVRAGGRRSRRQPTEPAGPRRQPRALTPRLLTRAGYGSLARCSTPAWPACRRPGRPERAVGRGSSGAGLGRCPPRAAPGRPPAAPAARLRSRRRSRRCPASASKSPSRP